VIEEAVEKMPPEIWFVVGPARSGTTFVTEELGHYAAINRETFVFSHLFPLLGILTHLRPIWLQERFQLAIYRWYERKTGYQVSDDLFAERNLDNFLQRLLTPERTDIPIVEKTPGHVAFFDLALPYLSSAQIVRMSRPIEHCVLSRRKANWKRFSLIDAGVKWGLSTSFQKQNGNREILVNYDCLVSDFDGEFEKVLQHLGTPERIEKIRKSYVPGAEPWKAGSADGPRERPMGSVISDLAERDMQILRRIKSWYSGFPDQVRVQHPNLSWWRELSFRTRHSLNLWSILTRRRFLSIALQHYFCLPLKRAD